MSDVDAEDMRALRDRMRQKLAQKTLPARRIQEARIPSYSSRRAMSKSERTEQTNLKFSPATKKRLIALAQDAGETMVEYIERAIEVRAEHEGKKQ